MSALHIQSKRRIHIIQITNIHKYQLNLCPSTVSFFDLDELSVCVFLPTSCQIKLLSPGGNVGIRIVIDWTLIMGSIIFSILNWTTKISAKRKTWRQQQQQQAANIPWYLPHLTFSFTNTRLFITFTKKTRWGKRTFCFSSGCCSLVSLRPVAPCCVGFGAR